jgi:hypothetical protein
MMEVYELDGAGEEYPTLGAVDEKDNGLEKALLVGRAMASNWSPIALQTYGDKRQKKKGVPDCDFWLSAPVFSEPSRFWVTCLRPTANCCPSTATGNSSMSIIFLPLFRMRSMKSALN